MQINGATVNGGVFQHSANLVALNTRQSFAVAVNAGDFLGVLQA
jgi:hypothetical protein